MGSRTLQIHTILFTVSHWLGVLVEANGRDRNTLEEERKPFVFGFEKFAVDLEVSLSTQVGCLTGIQALSRRSRGRFSERGDQRS